ncbi:MAG: phosphoribosylamine--glycine ligase [Gammaproteobacteria bacterium]
MNVLIVGNGGREHALAWKVAQSPQVDKVYVAPGNAGTATESGVENVAIKATDIPALLDFARREQIDLTIVGPEAPLVAGIADAFQQAGLRCFGPSKAAAQLEGSKAFAKNFLQRYNIPTARYENFTDLDAALAYLQDHALPVVIKADGLAAGKGVIIAQNIAEAELAVRDMLAGNKFGDAGHRVVIEEFLAGEEASFIVVASGQQFVALASSQDHKARDAGDQGPNTGGMGAYSPAPVVTTEMHARIVAEIIQPTLAGLASEGIDYLGFLYAGVMITADGMPKVLEFNCRFGDPETQPILLRLQSDLVALCSRAIDQQLDGYELDWEPRVALGVVLAAEGYPGEVRNNDVITGLDAPQPDHVKVFQAGTKLCDGEVVTAGGRVLCVTALGNDIAGAQQNAYKAVQKINWSGMFYRPDIGYRAIKRI